MEPSEAHSFLEKVNMRSELWRLIQAAATSIRHMNVIFHRKKNYWRHRAQLSIQTNGGHFKQRL
jgi:hypothetical protein